MADKKKIEDQETPKKKTAAKAEKAEAKIETKAAAKPAKKASSPKNTGVKRAPLLVGTTYPQHGSLTKWLLVDATNQPLGRLSSYVAQLLMGKHKPNYTRFADTGDAVVVVNAEKIVLTGNKWKDKQYNYHTNYPGGLKTMNATEMKEKHPERIIEWAVWGMLPKFKGHMARRWHKKLRVFTGTEHPHKAQNPQPVKLPNLGAWERN